MKDLKHRSWKFLSKFWPIGIILVVVSIFFYPVWLKGLVPIPSDFIVGVYYPWLDYKWGQIVGVTVKNPITSDVVSVIYPLRSLAIDILKHGEIPLWNPLMFAGYPLLANYQVAIFSPTVIFYFLLPKIWAWTAQIIMQPLLAALFSYIFLRHLKLNKLPSLIGGLIYAFAGFNVIWLEWNAHSLTAAWIPLILYFVDKYLVEEKRKWAVFFSITVALQILSGYPQLLVYTLISLLLLLFFRKNVLSPKKVVTLLVFLLTGISFTSIQTIPAFELFLRSQRISEFLPKDLAFLPWKNIISFFAPDYFGNHATGNFWGEGNYTNNAGYTGLISFILATISLVLSWRKKEVKFLLSLFIVSLLFSLPFPWTIWLTKVSFFAASATRILVLTNLSIAFLAAYGLDTLLVNRDKKELRSLVLPGFILLGVFVWTYYSFRVFPEKLHFLVGLRNLVLPIFFLLTSLSVLVIRHFFSKKLGRLAALFLGFVAIAELFRFGWKYTPFSLPKFVFPETPVLTFLKGQEKPFRIVASNTIPMNMWVPYGLESSSGYDAVYPGRWAKYLSTLNSGGISDSPASRYGDITNFENRLFDLANTKYLVSLTNDNKLGPSKLGSVFTDKSVTVFENENVLPRAFVVYRWEVIKEEREILALLLDPKFPLDRRIILEEALNQIQTGKGENKAEFISYTSLRSTFRVTTEEPGILFNADAWYPGWKVFVDGKQKELLRADYVFRAVQIPEGRHIVEFIYDPESFRIGPRVSFATLIVLIGILYGQKVEKRLGVTRKSPS